MTNVTQEESSELVNEQEDSTNETSNDVEDLADITHPRLTILALSSIGMLGLLMGFLAWNSRKSS